MSRKNQDARGWIRAQVALALVIALGGCAEASSPPLGQELEGPHLFVAGREDGRVHVLDAVSLDEVASVVVGAGASEVHATPDGSIVWALATGAAQVALIDASTLETRIVPVGLRPVHSYLDPRGDRIWIGNDGSGDVSIVDLADGEESRHLTGNGHHKMAFVTDDAGALAFVYVSNIADGTIAVLDPEGALVRTVSVGPSPHGNAYSPATRRVYSCSGDEQNSLEVLDPWGDHQIVSRIALPGRCGWAHVDPDDGRQAWVGLASVGLLARVDLEHETFQAWEAGPWPDKCAIDGERAFVANVTEPTVSVIDLVSGARRTIAIGRAHLEDGRGHRGLRRFGDRLFVPNEDDGTMTAIDLATESVIATVSGIPGVSGIAVAGGGIGTPPE